MEASLSSRLQQATSHLAAAQERERGAAEQQRAAAARLAAVEARQEQETAASATLRAQVERLEGERRAAVEACEELEAAAAGAREGAALQAAEWERERALLQASLEEERVESEGRRRKGLALVEQLRERDRRLREVEVEALPSLTSSPTPSLSRLSTTSPLAPREEQEPWHPSLYEQGGASATLLETLHAQLKLREGEVAGLQAEVAAMARVREGMAEEVTRLTIRTEQVEPQLWP